MILNGKEVATHIKGTVKQEIENLGVAPTLAVIQVGSDPASSTYVKNKGKACEYCGINATTYNLDENTEQSDLINLIEELNQNKDVNGILVQLPLPKHIDERSVIEAIGPVKDVDCFTYENVGRLFAGNPRFLPCTPAGIIEILKYYNIPMIGKNAVVLGRSNIVGKPISMLLQKENCNVTMLHSKTPQEETEKYCMNADIIVVATGVTNTILGRHLYGNHNCTIIDVGIHRDINGKLFGDVSEYTKAECVENYTPVPGGVGPMTIAMLMKNTLQAYKLMNNM